MTLPASGQLSISQIRGEFGGSAPDSISEYYGVAAGVPTSGAISISDFYGTSALNDPAFSRDSFAQSRTITGSGTAIAGINLVDDGSLTVLGIPILSNQFWHPDWPDTSLGPAFQARATLNSGSVPSQGESLNVWHTIDPAVGNSIGWQVRRSTLGTTFSFLTISLRAVGGSSILDTCTINMSATIQSGGGGGNGGGQEP